MSLTHRLSQIRSMSPRLVLAKGTALLIRRLRQSLLGALMRHQPTYPASLDAVPLARRLPPPRPLADGESLRGRVATACAHVFDLLGSGPVRVEHPAAGQENWRALVIAGYGRANARRAARLLAMIDNPAYRPIDWHRDFRSGHRWSSRVWGGAIAYGHRAGVDVKVPWELARLQHLPLLALAHRTAPDPRLAAEFHDQTLDFLASNPPGWGVNWACAMDVAIRAANLSLAWQWFAAQQVAFSAEFEEELAAGLLAHGRHVVHHLEWSADHRANHYLADLAGLAFVAATLPRGEETDLWLVFAAQQLEEEIPRQFLADGGNFEASAAYHRLSLEMALFAVALIVGLDDDRRQAFADYDAGRWGLAPRLRPGPMAWPPFGPTTLERLSLGLGFARALTKPAGDVVQVGDNDSGRFFVLGTVPSPLDIGHLWRDGPETDLLRDLSRGLLPPPAATLPWQPVPGADRADPPAVRLRIGVPDPTALEGLEPFAFPDFGLYGWRNGRVFLSIRCGRLHDGRGAHAHNDQLAVELEIDGVAFIRDPGTFTYTADLALRNAYRSALAHMVPRRGTAEPAPLNGGPFRLDDHARAECLRFTGLDFLGRHQGFGAETWRRVRVERDAIVIEDGPGSGETENLSARDPAELARLWGLRLAFSPGYGMRASGP